MSLHCSWRSRLASEKDKPYFEGLVQFLKEERSKHTVFPPVEDVFTAFQLPFEDVKVVILGQDPYHNAEQAHGLSFSVRKGVRSPPSLLNIFKELEGDIEGFRRPDHGSLQGWADQGVLLLNSVLTVRAHKPGSHRDQGWENFTTAAFEELSAHDRPLVFILWGRWARSKAVFIESHHHVIESTHPSPMSASRGFFGSKPFSKANAFLIESGQEPIDWSAL